MPKPLALTQDQQREMLASYKTKQANATELSEMYGIASSTFYRLLHESGGDLQRPMNAIRKNGKIPIAPVPGEIEVPVTHTAPVEVVVNKEQLVQSAHPVRRVGLKTWEVSYTGSVLVEAEEIEEAIKAARQLGMVKRIYSVKVK